MILYNIWNILVRENEKNIELGDVIISHYVFLQVISRPFLMIKNVIPSLCIKNEVILCKIKIKHVKKQHRSVVCYNI